MLKLSGINSSVLFKKEYEKIVKKKKKQKKKQTNKNYKEIFTFVPLGLSITNTSFQTCMPVVSLSQPPRHVKPVNGSLFPPIQL